MARFPAIKITIGIASPIIAYTSDVVLFIMRDLGSDVSLSVPQHSHSALNTILDDKSPSTEVGVEMEKYAVRKTIPGYSCHAAQNEKQSKKNRSLKAWFLSGCASVVH